MGKSAPKPPNAAKTSQAQAKYNTIAAKDQQQINAIPQANNFGSSGYFYDQSGNVRGQTSSLNQPLSQTAANLQGTMGQLSGLLPQDNFDSTTAAPDTSHLAKNFYDQGSGLMQRDFDRDNKQFEVRMAERGLPVGGANTSEAYNDANMARMDSQNFARGQLASQATQMAPQEQQRLISNARTDYLQPGAAIQGYGQNLGLLSGLAPKAPTPQAGIAAPNHSGNVNANYQAQAQNYQNQQAGLGSMLGAIGSIAAAPMTGGTSLIGGLFSDVRLKEAIKEVGTLADGQKVYSYRYVGIPLTHIGLLAHEVEEHAPNAIGEQSGYKTVNYDIATQAAANILKDREAA